MDAPESADAQSDPEYQTVRVGYGEIAQQSAVEANRRWWDDEADTYQAEHGAFLAGALDLSPDLVAGAADFVWCPEGLREADIQLLGPLEKLASRLVLEIGCGAAQCGRWLAQFGIRVIATDISGGQLRHAVAAAHAAAQWPAPLLAQADAGVLPLGDASVDIAFSAFGAIPFVTDSAAVMREIARVVRPGGRWVFSTNHPMRWCMLDDPGAAGLVIERSYFDRGSYIERAEDGAALYVESHRTVGDRIRELVAAGFRVLDVIEPEWPDGHDRIWGQWSPLRGELFPGTAIFVAEREG
jgi:SAM-dependent methyltransferase